MPFTLSAEMMTIALRALPTVTDESLNEFNSSFAAAGGCEKLDYEKIPAGQLSTRSVRAQVIAYAHPTQHTLSPDA